MGYYVAVKMSYTPCNKKDISHILAYEQNISGIK